jgi:ABC-type dipeptide/oligopeptide/nickel transport system ATPase component
MAELGIAGASGRGKTITTKPIAMKKERGFLKDNFTAN